MHKSKFEIINLNDTREDYKGIFYNSGKYCAINGYTAIRLSFRPYGIADAKKDFDVNKAIGDIRRYSAELTIPAAATIRKDVKIAKFGSFLLKRKNARIGRNPKTGVEAEITPRTVISFRPSNRLKNAVNK